MTVAIAKLLGSEEWRREHKVSTITSTSPGVVRMGVTRLAVLLGGRDKVGRPVVVVTARNHSLIGRDMDDMTQYMVHVLVSVCTLDENTASKIKFVKTETIGEHFDPSILSSDM
ncbi:hypothetical protein GWK47_052588 [Chionoecetes opilio]|uniref:Uncharacterized protein n=1 Tax=Chionoecetes opilio TaxID=41210 RepID=A0A8J4Y1J5_CHIOP|nr:hypothetical protein GWK47_052588 [Chionoecetes opilio]